MPVFCQGGVRLKSGLHHFIIETLKSYLLIEKIGWMPWPVNRRNSLPCSVMTSRQRLFNQGWIVCYVLNIISYSWLRVLYPFTCRWWSWLFQMITRYIQKGTLKQFVLTRFEYKYWYEITNKVFNGSKFFMNIYECHYKAVAYLKS